MFSFVVNWCALDYQNKHVILAKCGENISVKHSTNSSDFGFQKDSIVKKWISGKFPKKLSLWHTTFVYCTQFIQKIARFCGVEEIFENILYSISCFCLKYFKKSSKFWTFPLLVKYFSWFFLLCREYFLLWKDEASCARYIELTWCKPLPYYWIFTFSFEWAKTFFLQLHSPSVQLKLHFPINFHSIFFHHSSFFTWFFFLQLLAKNSKKFDLG